MFKNQKNNKRVIQKEKAEDASKKARPSSVGNGFYIPS